MPTDIEKMSQFILTVHSDVFASQTSRSAYKFAQTLLMQSHELLGIFFYQQGVLHANASNQLAEDELNTQQLFIQLSQEYNVRLMVCSTAAEQRGINSDNLAEGFQLAGLAEFAALTGKADRMVQFK